MKNAARNTLKNNSDNQFIFEVLNAVKSIKYGYVQITIHNSKVVQIDRTEKIRMDKAGQPETKVL